LGVVGGPVGPLSFAKHFVKQKVDEHKKRLSHVLTLSSVDPHIALVILHHCCVSRINYLMQIVPFLAAPLEYAIAFDDILSVWQTITGITNDEMEKPTVKERVSLPYSLGGQNITDFTISGDAALLGCWGAIAADLCTTVPALSNLGSSTSTLPRWGFLDAARERLAARGPTVKSLVPPAAGMLLATYPRLQHKLLAAINKDTFDKLLDGHTTRDPINTSLNTHNQKAHTRNRHALLRWHSWRTPAVAPADPVRKARRHVPRAVHHHDAFRAQPRSA
jgi:hypothetical protein